MDKVAAYIEKHSKWSSELRLLRKLLLETELEEQIKWGAPVYSLNGKNVVGLGAFKNHYGIWFFQGVFLKDEHQVLHNAQEGKTKALRQMRFELGTTINEELIRKYLLEAIDNQRAGKEVKPERKKKVELPSELSSELKRDKELKTSFEALSPGKQREYAEHIASAKREVTRQNRLEKSVPMIKQGVGLHDKYKNC
jgi:uncharacterized protein YdeI (YjbR/CyaY-like superfamily)